MATFYFNGAVNGDWQTLGNWWMAYNAETNTHSVPAMALPTSTDDIEVRGNIATNSGAAPTVANASFFGTTFISNISITATGDCTLNDSSLYFGTIIGDCTLNDNARSGGFIYGNCTFNDSSYHSGNIIGANCTFNDYSFSYGGVSSNCTFNDAAYTAGFVAGDCTFNDSSYNFGGTITGDCTFNDNATNYWISTYEWDLGAFYVGTVNGNCTFSLSSAALHIDAALAQIKTSDSITGTIDFKYEKGINGSSILGIV